MTVLSPCTGICKLDDASGWCLGCGRSGDEIAVWGSQNENWRNAVWKQIPSRMNQLGVVCSRLPWTVEQIHEFVARSCQENQGTWVIGVMGAVAEFRAAPDAQVELLVRGDALVVKTINGAMRMMINDDVRALTFDPPDSVPNQRIVLAVKRERGRLPVANGLSDLGEDRGAILSDDDTHLFDLGLGRKEGRFCVRVGRGSARDALEDSVGLRFMDALPLIGAALIAESPARVVESALGRIEVQGPIPVPGFLPPHGPHTHLLPDYIATGRALPVGMDLPRAYLPGAIFYPNG